MYLAFLKCDAILKSDCSSHNLNPIRGKLDVIVRNAVNITHWPNKCAFPAHLVV